MISSESETLALGLTIFEKQSTSTVYSHCAAFIVMLTLAQQTQLADLEPELESDLIPVPQSKRPDNVK